MYIVFLIRGAILDSCNNERKKERMKERERYQINKK